MRGSTDRQGSPEPRGTEDGLGRNPVEALRAYREHVIDVVEHADWLRTRRRMQQILLAAVVAGVIAGVAFVLAAEAPNGWTQTASVLVALAAGIGIRLAWALRGTSQRLARRHVELRRHGKVLGTMAERAEALPGALEPAQARSLSAEVRFARDLVRDVERLCAGGDDLAAGGDPGLLDRNS